MEHLLSGAKDGGVCECTSEPQNECLLSVLGVQRSAAGAGGSCAAWEEGCISAAPWCMLSGASVGGVHERTRLSHGVGVEMTCVGGKALLMVLLARVPRGRRGASVLLHGALAPWMVQVLVGCVT
jgi:hypothetical protein